MGVVTFVRISMASLFAVAALALWKAEDPMVVAGTATTPFAEPDAAQVEARRCVSSVSQSPGAPHVAGPGLAGGGRVAAVVGSPTEFQFCAHLQQRTLGAFHPRPAADVVLAPYQYPGLSDDPVRFGYGSVRGDVAEVVARTPSGQVFRAQIRDGLFLVDLLGVPEEVFDEVVYVARDFRGRVVFEGRAIPLKS
ncbi:hypothetical protein [Saccharothrix variisporea]|uniref:Uncharacterized protein n=1 Tax=Saccharothrix variisporea TaxID=543527 RepID=A0A495XEK3_9PSEU|nr:hypothetical protein [Saccharothrix variisporea]RKT72452.1 hypothetical protein DFJ66_5763 [Saccharothrix variisporea]